MASTNYSFTIASDFPNGKMDSDRLMQEVRSSAIVTALDYVSSADGGCSIVFKDALSNGDVTILNGIVAAHSGAPLPNNTIIKVEQYSTGVAQPVAADGKPYVLPNIFPGEVLLNFTGAADNTGRMDGNLFGLQKAGVGTETLDIQFIDGFYLAGGHVDWDGGAWGNSVYMELQAPATTTKAPAVQGQGNCNKVATGLGFNIIVPAAGNGEFDIDVPIPVPANNQETNAQNGYWNYSEPWCGKGTVSVAVPGHGKYNLFDAQLELAHFCKLHTFRDAGDRDLIAPAIKPKWILPEWKVHIEIENTSSGTTFRVSWDLLMARRKSV
jgi:hypothetical protein